MILNFREIQRQVGARIQNTATSTSNANDLLPKIKDWINTRWQRVYRSYLWMESIDDYTQQLTASTSEYTFDRDVEEIITIFDQTNSKLINEDKILNHMRYQAPVLDKASNLIAGNPDRWRYTGVHTVKNETSQAETIDVVSTSASDVSPLVVHITGLVSGVELEEDIVVTGTSSATSSNTYDANQKLVINIGTNDQSEASQVGAITVDGTTSGTVYAKISPYETAHKYHWFKVSPTPKSSGTQPTWHIWYKKAFRPLVDDNDIPVLDCCLELVQGAFADALREDGLEKEAQIAENIFVNMVAELQATHESHTYIDQFKPEGYPITKLTQDAYQWVP